MPRRKKVVEEEVETQEVEPQEVDSKEDTPVLPHKQPEYSYNVLEDTNRVDTTRSILETIGNRKKNRAMDFRTMNEIRLNTIPVKNLYFQYAIGAYGLPQSSLIQVIGREGLGKTSFCLKLAGWAMEAGAPCLYINCESKEMKRERTMRCLSSDPDKAARMAQVLETVDAKTLHELEDKVEAWTAVQRGELEGNKGQAVSVPKDTPLLVIVDPWGKLMSKEEASGLYDWGNITSKDPSKAKNVGEGSNFGHSKFAQGWSRRLSLILKQRNVTMVLVHHQNANLGGNQFSPIPAELLEKYNCTYTGGKGLSQTASLILIFTPGKQHKVGTNVIGQFTNVRIHKSSIGEDGKEFLFEIRKKTDMFDKPGFLQPAIDFSKPMADWMVDNKLLSTRVSMNRYSCEPLSISGATASELVQALEADSETIERLGEDLNIDGYQHVVDDIQNDLD